MTGQILFGASYSIQIDMREQAPAPWWVGCSSSTIFIHIFAWYSGNVRWVFGPVDSSLSFAFYERKEKEEKEDEKRTKGRRKEEKNGRKERMNKRGERFERENKAEKETKTKEK